MLRAHGTTDRGGIRASNEDCFALDEELQLLVVADGLGGHNAGELAARLAVESFVDFVRQSREREEGHAADGAGSSVEEWPFGFDPSLSDAGNRVRTGICFANALIIEQSMQADEYSGMGTTLVVALIERGRMAIGHVGDSRLYVLARNGLRLLTQDDTWMATMLAQDPAAVPALVRDHPMRNALTNVVGGRRKTDVHVVEVDLEGGEVLLLSTDGVHDALGKSWLDRLLTKTGDVRAMAESLVSAALTRGSRDNCTAVVARYSA